MGAVPEEAEEAGGDKEEVGAARRWRGRGGGRSGGSADEEEDGVEAEGGQGLDPASRSRSRGDGRRVGATTVTRATIIERRGRGGRVGEGNGTLQNFEPTRAVVNSK